MSLRVPFTCAYCGSVGTKASSHANRSARIGAALYCDRSCAAAARKTDTRSLAEKRADKRAYDKAYRATNDAMLQRKRAEWYARYGPANRQKEAEKRRERMPQHVEYCRQPQYRAKKHEYDVQRVSAKYDEFAEAHRILVELEREIRRRVPDKYERLKARGYYERQNEKAKERRNARRISTT